MMTVCLHSQAYHGEPLADDSDAQNKENVEANDPDGLLPQNLEA